MKSLVLVFAVLCFACTSKSQTTQEEYNYVTKGYKVQVESGLDMKKGYELLEVDYVRQNNSNGTLAREGWLKALYRVAPDGRQLVAYMVIYHKSGRENEYLCVPSPASTQEMKNTYFQALNPPAFDNSDRLQLIAFLVSQSLRWQ